jgi:phytoene dehydrogenase-like protein
LLPNKSEAKKVNNLRFTSSALMFYWAVDKVQLQFNNGLTSLTYFQIYPQIGHHNVFLNGDYKKSFDSIFVDHAVPDEPSFYVNAPQRTDPSAAPKGKFLILNLLHVFQLIAYPGEDSLMVLVPVGYLDEKNATKEFWAKKTKEVREYVFNRLARVGITDLREHIKWEVTRDPIEWRDMYVQSG